MDMLLRVDRLIEEKVYNRPEPTEDPESFTMLGWVKEPDGRYYNYVCDTNTRSFYPKDMWPRTFSATMQLAWMLVEKFLIHISPVITADGVLCGWLAKCGNAEVEDISAPMAICLLTLKTVEWVEEVRKRYK